MTILSIQKKPVFITLQVDHLNLSFEAEWYQENIASLSESIFSLLAPVTIQEQIVGADRENIRFSCLQNYFILNFEFYSQSCWIEGQDSQSKECLEKLYGLLVEQNDAGQGSADA